MDCLVRIFFVFLVCTGISQAVVCQSFAASPSAEAKAPLFYTVQVGSFADEEEALTWYTRLAKSLPADAKQFLRIETAASLYTVRVGKAEKREDIITLFTETQRITQRSPAIIQGYFSPQKITKIYDPTVMPPLPEQPAGTPGPATTHAESHVTALPHTVAAGKASQDSKGMTESLSPGDAPEESLDTTQGAPLPTRQREKKETKTVLSPPLPPPVKMPDAAMKQMVIDKYLINQASSKTGHDLTIKQNLSFPESPSCISAACHQELSGGKVVHLPVQSTRCLACHQPINQQHPGSNGPDFKLTAQGADLCAKCHPRLKGKKYSHPPALEGDCTECHSPHASDNPFLLTVAADNQSTLCMKCHDKDLVTKKYTHGPVGLGACTYCHAPHESDHPALLKNDSQALCFECHTDIEKGVRNSLSVHKPMQTAGCASCHLPHGSDSPSLLKQSGEDFCFTCHSAIDDKYSRSRSKHAGLYLDKQCSTCHQPHYSPYPNLLNNTELDLCLTCHSEKNPVRSKSPKNIAIELQKTFVHEPVAKGECTGCHDPHGSKYLQLLTGPYPDSFYAPYDKDMYDLCFSCHDKELLTNPTTETATSFRNGSINLHNLHATIPRKGRTCQTCHQPHASDGPKLINQTGSSFGEWQMSISFTTTAKGGTCMPGCHRKMEYNRENAFDNSIKESDFGSYHVEYESLK